MATLILDGVPGSCGSGCIKSDRSTTALVARGVLSSAVAESVMGNDLPKVYTYCGKTISY
jgi:hypothetical protein